MKLIVHGIRDRDCERTITGALFKVDIGARINFDPEAELVRIEGRLTVFDATGAIERAGFRVASVVDDAIVDAVSRPARGQPRAWPRTSAPAA